MTQYKFHDEWHRIIHRIIWNLGRLNYWMRDDWLRTVWLRAAVITKMKHGNRKEVTMNRVKHHRQGDLYFEPAVRGQFDRQRFTEVEGGVITHSDRTNNAHTVTEGRLLRSNDRLFIEPGPEGATVTHTCDHAPAYLAPLGKTRSKNGTPISTKLYAVHFQVEYVPGAPPRRVYD